MKKLNLGRTGFVVSEIGLGAWPLGGAHYGRVEAGEAACIVERYLELGGNFIDTARVYGQSENVVGSVLASGIRREKVIVATKTTAGEYTDSIPQIRIDLEQSLRELQSDYVDLYYLHHPPETPDEMSRAIDEMDALKAEGKIRAIGASIKGLDVTDQTEALCRMYIESGRVDVIQVVYSMLRQRNRNVIKLAYQRGVGVVARTTLESGFLSAKYQSGHIFSEGDHRSRYAQERIDDILENVERINNEILKAPFESLPQIAVKFALQQSGVSAAIVGAKSTESLERNIAIAELPDLDDNTVAWIEREYGNFTNRASSH